MWATLEHMCANRDPGFPTEAQNLMPDVPVFAAVGFTYGPVFAHMMAPLPG